MATATAKLNALLNLKKVAQIWAKRVVIPGWTKEKLIEAAVQRRLYKTKSAASKVSNATLATQLGIDPTTGESKQKTDKPATQTKKTTTPEVDLTPKTSDFEKLKISELRSLGANFGVKGKGKAELIRKIQEAIKAKQAQSAKPPQPEKKVEPDKTLKKIKEKSKVTPVTQSKLPLDKLRDDPTESVSPERMKDLQDVLSQYGTNLSPVIVQRTKEGKLNTIHGGEWVKAAKKLGGIDSLQVQLMDIDDDEAEKVKETMTRLNRGTKATKETKEKETETLAKPKPKDVLKAIEELDQELETENYLPIYHVREKFKHLKREELDELLYELEKNDEIEFSSVQESLHYTPDQLAAGIPQEIGGALFFIMINEEKMKKKQK